MGVEVSYIYLHTRFALHEMVALGVLAFVDGISRGVYSYKNNCHIYCNETHVAGVSE